MPFSKKQDKNLTTENKSALEMELLDHLKDWRFHIWSMG